jgi:hypothetical protein
VRTSALVATTAAFAGFGPPLGLLVVLIGGLLYGPREGAGYRQRVADALAVGSDPLYASSFPVRRGTGRIYRPGDRAPGAHAPRPLFRADLETCSAEWGTRSHYGRALGASLQGASGGVSAVFNCGLELAV